MDASSTDFRRRLAIAARAPEPERHAAPAARGARAPASRLLEQPDRGGARRARANYRHHRTGWCAPDEALIAADLRWLDASGGVLLPATAAAYPPLLRESPDAPAVLYVRGDVRILSEPQLAMVGSRNPTAGGQIHGARVRGVLRARRHHHHQRARARHRCRLSRRRAGSRRPHDRGARLRARPDLSARARGARRAHRRERRARLGVSARHAAVARPTFRSAIASSRA